MKFQIGAMSVGDILDRGLKLLLARLPALYIINLIVLSPVIAYQLVLPWILMDGERPPGPEVLVGFLLGTVGVLFLSLTLQPIGTAAILHIISQEFVDRHVGIGPSLVFALTRFAPLLLGSILYAVICVAGSPCCLIPTFFFMTLFAFFAQVIVVEGLGPLAAFERSMQLGKEYRWRIFGVIILTLFLPIVIQMIIGAGLELLLPSIERVPIAGEDFRLVTNHGNQTIHTIVSQLVGILLQSYQAVCVTLLYFDLRIRKEGYDLEVAAQSQQDTPLEALPAEPEVDLPDA